MKLSEKMRNYPNSYIEKHAPNITIIGWADEVALLENALQTVEDHGLLATVNRFEAENARLREACKLTAAIVIDGYDAGDEPLNAAWDACVAALAQQEE